MIRSQSPPLKERDLTTLSWHSRRQKAAVDFTPKADSGLIG
jgi:hypothetical protein